MIASPYNLETGDSSRLFYTQLSDFTDNVIENANGKYSSVIDDYLVYLDSKGIKKYTHSEYLIELLMTGMFWSNYSNYISVHAVFYEPVFNSLYKWRKRVKFLKGNIDKLRGKLNTSILMHYRGVDIPVYQRFEYMNSWLNCSKEFVQEVERLKYWQNYIEQKTVSEQSAFWDSAVGFAEWFTLEADKALGDYTLQWNNFRIDTANIYPNREDYIFCTRKPNEYHLNMVAAEVMNRALSNGFNKAKDKIVLLPTCMSNSENCKAKTENGRLNCQKCSQDCNVARLSKRLGGEKVETVLIPHSSGFSKYLEPWKNQEETALVGVACVLNLLTGGYEMQKLNIPSQCVFLDSSACKKHWLSGTPTRLNELQLDSLLYNQEVKEKQEVLLQA